MFKNLKTEIKWAFIFIGTLLVWMTLERLFGLHDKHIAYHPMVSFAFMIPAIIVFVLALKDKKKSDYNGNVTYLQLFKSGIIISVIIALLTPLTQWFISNVITPDYFENAINYSVESGNVSLEEAEAYFNYKNYVIEGSIFAIISGVVTTAIIALFLRTKAK